MEIGERTARLFGYPNDVLVEEGCRREFLEELGLEITCDGMALVMLTELTFLPPALAAQIQSSKGEGTVFLTSATH